MARSESIVRALARALPKEFRERVFEPALADLQFDERSSGTRASSRWIARAFLIAECVRLVVPRLFWRRGRPTRLAIAVLAGVLFVTLLVQRNRYVAAWQPHRSDPPPTTGRS